VLDALSGIRIRPGIEVNEQQLEKNGHDCGEVVASILPDASTGDTVNVCNLQAAFAHASSLMYSDSVLGVYVRTYLGCKRLAFQKFLA